MASVLCRLGIHDWRICIVEKPDQGTKLPFQIVEVLSMHFCKRCKATK